MSDFLDLVRSLNPVMSRVFVRGTVDVLDAYERATTLPATGRWGNMGKRFGVQHVGAPTIVVDGAEQRGTSGTLFTEIGRSVHPTADQHLITKRSGAGDMWRFLLGAPVQTLQFITSAGVSSLAHTWYESEGFAVTFENGSFPEFFVDGASVGSGSLVSTVVPASVQVNIGARYDSTQPVLVPEHCALQFSEVLSDAIIQELHTEFLKVRVDSRTSKSVVVPVSLSPAGVIDTETFGAELSAAGTLVGKRGVSVGTLNGVVTQSKRIGQGYIQGNTVNSFINFSNPSSLIPVDNGALCTVITPAYSTIPSTRYMFLGNASSNTLLNQSTLGAIVGAKGSPSVQISSPNGTAHAGVPLHLVLTWWLDGATRRFQLFVDGVSMGESTFAGSNVATVARLLGSTGLGWMGSTPGARFFSTRITPAQARTLYIQSSLLGAALDNSEHMPPVTLTSKTAGNVGPWAIGSGTWDCVDPEGIMTLENVAAGWAARPCPAGCQAFGAWYLRASKALDASTSTVIFVSDTRGSLGTTGLDGYSVEIAADESVTVDRITNGAVAATVLTSAPAFVSVGTEYEFFLTRRYDGLFTLYIRGGAYTTWTVVGSATDTTHTTSHFVVADLDAGDTISTLQFFPLGGNLLPKDVPGLEN